MEKTRQEHFETWKRKLKLSKELHKKKVCDWADKVFCEYSGEAKVNTDTNERYSQMAQVIISVEETIQPHLFFQSPRLSATAKKPEWEKRERLAAAVVNHEYSDIKPSGHTIELENELVVLDARLLPFGCTKTSWEAKGDILQEPVESGMIDKMKGLFTGQPEPMLETPVIESEKHVTERVNPLKVFLDYSADHITKRKFTIEMMDVTREALRKPRYDQALIDSIEPSIALVPEEKFKSRDEKERYLKDPDFKGYRIYEIEDLETRKIHTLMEGLEDFIEFDAPHPLPEGSQYSFLWFIEVPNEVYPLPPIKFYRQRASEFSYIYSQVSEQIDKFLPKILVNVSKMEKGAQEKFRIGGLGTLTEVTETAGAVEVVSPQVQPDLFKYMAMVKELMNLEAGVNDYETQVPEQRKATEAKIIDQGTRARRFKPKKRVKGFLVNQAHTIFLTLQTNSTVEQYIKVLGEQDALEWWEDPATGKQSWTREDLIGDYNFDFDVESITPQDEQARQLQNDKSMVNVLNPQLKQNLLEEGIELLTAPIFEKYAKDNLGIKDKNRIMRKLDGLEPGDEHTLWMQGQYPEIGERELKDPKFLVKHVQAHDMFINSPGFQGLPPEFQQQAMMHRASYEPHLAKLQQRSQPRAQQRQAPPEPQHEPEPEGMLA